jgi:hypothetical protein
MSTTRKVTEKGVDNSHRNSYVTCADRHIFKFLYGKELFLFLTEVVDQFFTSLLV